MYCRYLPSGEADTKLYCLVTEAHVCEQLAQGRYPTVSWCGLEPAPLSDLRITSPARYRSTTEPHTEPV